jgi:TetR/AcrR family transcriptional regulator, transcriptional repressor for nem operon
MARPRGFDADSAVAASLGLFRRRGYRATSIRDLSAHLDLNLSSIYRAYGDKHGLFLRALDHYRLSESARGCQLFMDAEPTIDGLCGSLMAVVLTEEDPNSPAGCFVVNTAAELGSSDPDVVERTEQAFELTRRGLSDLVDRMRRNRALRRDADVEAMVDTLFTLILGWRLRVRAGHDPAAVAASVSAAVQPWATTSR